MPAAVSRLRTLLRRPAPKPVATKGSAEACSWDALRTVYREQAQKGDPEAIRGLELIEQDRWPSSGRPRGR